MIRRERWRAMARVTLTRLNVPRVLCNYVLGHEHKTSQRLAAGAVVMAAGVSLAHVHCELELLTYCADGVGYLVHGLGCVPFVEALSQKADRQ